MLAQCGTRGPPALAQLAGRQLAKAVRLMNPRFGSFNLTPAPPPFCSMNWATGRLHDQPKQDPVATAHFPSKTGVFNAERYCSGKRHSFAHSKQPLSVLPLCQLPSRLPALTRVRTSLGKPSARLPVPTRSRPSSFGPSGRGRRSLL